jgi:hypothetical protein
VGGAAERIGDRGVPFQPDRSLQSAVDLSDQHGLRGDRTRVELPQRPERLGVVIVGYAKDDRH